MAGTTPTDKVTGDESGEDWIDDGIEVSDKELEADDDALADSDDEDDSAGDEDEAALDKLEAEELEMLTEDEAAETLPVDEAEELRQIRREVIALETTAESAGEDEFVCSGCFLVKRMTQLADKRKMLCRDCA